MKTTASGQKAEGAVAIVLEKRGFKILGQNWKTAVCEIDIVAKKGQVVYFVEVKYRSEANQGSGVEYIGPQKLKKINFAARVWNQHHGWDGDYRLMAAEVTGLDFDSIKITEIS